MPQVVRDLDETDVGTTDNNLVHGCDLAVTSSACHLTKLDVHAVFDGHEFSTIYLTGFKFNTDDESLALIEELEGNADGGHLKESQKHGLTPWSACPENNRENGLY